MVHASMRSGRRTRPPLVSMMYRPRRTWRSVPPVGYAAPRGSRIAVAIAGASKAPTGRHPPPRHQTGPTSHDALGALWPDHFGVASSLSAETEDEDVGVHSVVTARDALHQHAWIARPMSIPRRDRMASSRAFAVRGRRRRQQPYGAPATRIGDARRRRRAAVTPRHLWNGPCVAPWRRIRPCGRRRWPSSPVRSSRSNSELRLARAPFIVLDRLGRARPGLPASPGRPSGRCGGSHAPPLQCTGDDTRHASTSSSVQRVDPLGSTGQRGETGRDGVRITDLVRRTPPRGDRSSAPRQRPAPSGRWAPACWSWAAVAPTSRAGARLCRVRPGRRPPGDAPAGDRVQCRHRPGVSP